MIKSFFDKGTGVTKKFRNKTFLSVLFNALGKGVYFLSILLISRLLGANGETDVYFFTISLITVFVGFSNLLNTDVLIPRIISLKHKNEQQLANIINYFYTIYFLISCVTIGIIACAPEYFLNLFSKFKASTVSNDYLVFLMLFPTLLLNVLMGLQSSILLAYNFFVTPPLITFIANCLSIGVFYILRDSMGIQGAIIGLILSGIFANLALAFYLLKLCKIKIKPSLKIDLSIFQSLEWVTLLYISYSFYSVGLIYLLSIAQEGSLTAYNSAQLIAFMPYQFIAVQLGTIMSNKIAEYYNTNQFIILKNYIKLMLVVMTIVILPICFFTIVFSKTIAHTISNIDKAGIFYVSRLTVLIICFSIPAYFNAIYFCAIRLYTSTLRVKFTSIVQSVICVSLLIADYIGLRFYDFRGFYIANIIMYSLIFIVSLLMIRNFYKIIELREANYAEKVLPSEVTVIA